MRIYGLLQKAMKLIYIALYNIFVFFTKIDENKVVIASNSRNTLSGNLLFIKNELEKENKYKIIVITAEETSSFFKKVKFRLKIISQICNAKTIIIDDFFPLLYALKIRKGARFIQAWHAIGAFKKVGYSRPDQAEKAKNGSLTHKNYTDVIVSSENIVDCYAEAFGCNKNIIHPIGTPRTDLFFDKNYIEDTKKRLYEKYPILKDKRVIVFAPTFRGAGKNSAHYNQEFINLDKLYKELNDNEVFVIKYHPFIKNKLEIKDEYKDKIVDLTKEREINDLLLITDLLITDYSSVIFEYALIRKSNYLLYTRL